MILARLSTDETNSQRRKQKIYTFHRTFPVL